MLKIIIIAFVLALDCLGVGLGVGCSNDLLRKEKIYIIFYFASFQFVFAFSGAVSGKMVNRFLFTIGNGISGLIIIIIGIYLIWEAYSQQEESKVYKLNHWLYLILAVSVSLDAFAIGFSLLYIYKFELIAFYSLIIGLVTALMTFISFQLSNYIKRFYLLEKYSEYVAGLILLIIGLQMIL